VVFLTVVVGIARAGDLEARGAGGGQGLVYFEVATTVALAIGLVVANVLRPGEGVSKPGADAIAEIAPYVQRAQHQSVSSSSWGSSQAASWGAFTAEGRAAGGCSWRCWWVWALAMMRDRAERVVGALRGALGSGV
jgi:aerobic C4-dicarboxylate transport protein